MLMLGKPINPATAIVRPKLKRRYSPQTYTECPQMYRKKGRKKLFLILFPSQETLCSPAEKL